jgi:predicted O-methyltransferase YrrM
MNHFALLREGLRVAVAEPSRAVRALGRLSVSWEGLRRAERLRAMRPLDPAAFVSALTGRPREVCARAIDEVDDAGLGGRLEATIRRRYEGKPFKGGWLETAPGQALYALARVVTPAAIVETGVANGVSSTFWLAALAANRSGALYSIDYPRVEGDRLDPAEFPGRDLHGSFLTAGTRSGWAVPAELRDRWALVLGPSQRELPALLAHLGGIDVFLHDSLHTYDHMSFEFETAWGALRPGGVLLADNADWNGALLDFARARAVEPVRVDGHGLAGVRKPA